MAVLIDAIKPARLWIGLGWLVIILVLPVHGYVVRRRFEKQIGQTVSALKPGVEGEFRGILSLGFEVQSVTVATGRRFVVWPVLENWFALFPEKFNWDADLPRSRSRGSNDAAGWFIRFVGIPSGVGRFGHMGTCRRQVRITRVLAAQPVDT